MVCAFGASSLIGQSTQKSPKRSISSLKLVEDRTEMGYTNNPFKTWKYPLHCFSVFLYFKGRLKKRLWYAFLRQAAQNLIMNYCHSYWTTPPWGNNRKEIFGTEVSEFRAQEIGYFGLSSPQYICAATPLYSPSVASVHFLTQRLHLLLRSRRSFLLGTLQR